MLLRCGLDRAAASWRGQDAAEGRSAGHREGEVATEGVATAGERRGNGRQRGEMGGCGPGGDVATEGSEWIDSPGWVGFGGTRRIK